MGHQYNKTEQPCFRSITISPNIILVASDTFCRFSPTMPQSFLLELIPSCSGVIGDVLHFFIAVALVFVVVSSYIRPMLSSQIRHRLRIVAENRGSMLLGLFIGGLACGTIGNYIDHYAKLNPPPKKFFSSGEPVQTTDDKDKEEPDGLSRYWTDRVYLSWTQFFADGTVTPRDSFWTRIGRLFGLAFVSLLAYEAYERLFARENLDWILKNQRKHTLICGCGRIGAELAKNLLSDSRDVSLTVIEKDPSRTVLDELRDLGANVMIADATLRRNLERARCNLAKEIFVVTGSDEANLDIAADVISILGPTVKVDEIPKIYVHLNQMRLERIISEMIEKGDAKTPDRQETVSNRNPANQIFANESPTTESKATDNKATDNKATESEATKRKEKLREQILFFNPLEESMRDLFDDEVLLRRPKKPEEIAHYVIVGFGHTGQQMALFLAENAHFENLKRSRMTIVYRSEEQVAVNHFRKLYPKFFPQAHFVIKLQSEINSSNALWDVDPAKDDWSYGVELIKTNDLQEIDYGRSTGVGFAVNGGFVRMDGGCTSPAFIENLYELCYKPNVRPMVFICNADDEENCAEAIELRQVMDDRLKPKASAEKPYPAYLDSDHEVSIIAYVPNHPSLLKLLNANKGTLAADRVAWGACQESCKHIRLETDIIKKLADKISEAHGRDKAALPFRAAWEISSDRKAAIHLNAKLAVIDWRIISPVDDNGAILITDNEFIQKKAVAEKILAGSFSVTSPQDETTNKMIIMAKMEHHRWLAERVLQDWSLGRKSPDNVETRKRTSFVPWNMISDRDVEYNVNQIAKAFEFLNEMLEDPKAKPAESVKENNKLFTIHKRTH